MPTDVFISYRRSDREFVAMLAKALEDSGISVWYDAEIPLGAPVYQDNIGSALENARMVVVVFSKAANESSEIIKEIKAADLLKTPVIPVLLDDARPRGAYLYELPSRNCIIAFPEPPTRLGDVTRLLIDCVRSLEPRADGQMGSALTEGDPLPSRQDAPRIASAYVGKIHDQGQKAPMRDILPFRWADLAVLIPGVALFAWWTLAGPASESLPDGIGRYMAAGVYCLGLIAFFAAVVFPVRYYMRHRSPTAALGKYAISSLILYALLIGAFLVGKTMGAFPAEEDTVAGVAIFFGAIWLVFAVIAFVIYGVLATQRAVREFTRNLKIL